jgi:hypothetical protein
MPCWIGVSDRIIVGVAVAIERLWIVVAWNDCIGTDKPPDERVVITRVVIVQPNPRFLPLPREAEIGGRRAALRTPL